MNAPCIHTWSMVSGSWGGGLPYLQPPLSDSAPGACRCLIQSMFNPSCSDIAEYRATQRNLHEATRTLHSKEVELDHRTHELAMKQDAEVCALQTWVVHATPHLSAPKQLNVDIDASVRPTHACDSCCYTAMRMWLLHHVMPQHGAVSCWLPHDPAVCALCLLHRLQLTTLESSECSLVLQTHLAHSPCSTRRAHE